VAAAILWESSRELAIPVTKILPKNGSIAEFVGKRTVEKATPWKSPKAGLSHSVWKSRNNGGISTFPTAPATTVNFLISSQQEE
jgi:hypothetical protein